MQQKLLFLCTANYYRSRYCELLFNHYAEQHGLNWRADSRGILASLHNNPGPIYSVVVNRLEKMGVNPEKKHRYPLQLTEKDLEQAQVTIALKEAEHHLMMKRLFPKWADQISYWHIHDIDVESPEAALPEIDKMMALLIRALESGVPP